MLASLLMGMGLPTTPSYLILAVLGAPALIRLGVEPLAAHMFVFYFGCISMITPPVALAVYAATSIAESDFWKTSFEAVKLGITAFIVPYMFVYNPSLLAIGKPITILTTAITAIIGAVILGAGISGWLLVRADIKERILLIISGLFLIDPRFITNLLGLLGLVLVLIFHRKRKSLENSTSS